MMIVRSDNEESLMKREKQETSRIVIVKSPEYFTDVNTPIDGIFYAFAMLNQKPSMPTFG